MIEHKMTKTIEDIEHCVTLRAIESASHAGLLVIYQVTTIGNHTCGTNHTWRFPSYQDATDILENYIRSLGDGYRTIKTNRRPE